MRYLQTSREREMHLSQLLSDAEQKLLSTSEQSLQVRYYTFANSHYDSLF